MKNFNKILVNTQLFKCFTCEELDEIFDEHYYTVKDYEKNTIIYLQNEKCESLDIILKGVITIQKIDQDGKILTISDFMSGDVLGENLLFSASSNYPMTITAKTDCTLLHMKSSLVLSLCQKNKCFLKSFLMSLSSKTLILSNKIKSLTMKTIRQYIVDFLLIEYYSQGSNKIKLKMSKKDLAEKLGIQRSSLSRELNKMRSDGLVEFDANYIFIKDVDFMKTLHTN
ncbi:MAG: Crp/Fnr family transcriptional regulator [Sedimentibacter saalensis]|uniref:Crp/Fnr family transcriptional regulator n=1 Tax=Sedimentibacter saalensis TaxID=130788 RepID=UPI003157FD75